MGLREVQNDRVKQASAGRNGLSVGKTGQPLAGRCYRLLIGEGRGNVYTAIRIPGKKQATVLWNIGSAEWFVADPGVYPHGAWGDQGPTSFEDVPSGTLFVVE